jgi:hypothetical protein
MIQDYAVGLSLHLADADRFVGDKKGRVRDHRGSAEFIKDDLSAHDSQALRFGRRCSHLVSFSFIRPGSDEVISQKLRGPKNRYLEALVVCVSGFWEQVVRAL